MIDADRLERRIMTTYFDGETKARIFDIIDSLVKESTTKGERGRRNGDKQKTKAI